jgi:hypothetical protein
MGFSILSLRLMVEAVYKPRSPRSTPLYQSILNHLAEFESFYEERQWLPAGESSREHRDHPSNHSTQGSTPRRHHNLLFVQAAQANYGFRARSLCWTWSISPFHTPALR